MKSYLNAGADIILMGAALRIFMKPEYLQDGFASRVIAVVITAVVLQGLSYLLNKWVDKKE